MMIKLGYKNLNEEVKRAIKMAPIDATTLLLQTVSRPVYDKDGVSKGLKIVDTSFHYFSSYKAAKKFAADDFMDTEKGYSLNVSMPMFVKNIKAYRTDLGSFNITNYLIPLK